MWEPRMHEVRASMAGKVLAIVAGAGTAVAEGDDLLVLESMKMEIPITSPAAGVVEQVRVGVGATVQPGDLLMTLRA